MWRESVIEGLKNKIREYKKKIESVERFEDLSLGEQLEVICSTDLRMDKIEVREHLRKRLCGLYSFDDVEIENNCILLKNGKNYIEIPMNDRKVVFVFQKESMMSLRCMEESALLRNKNVLAKKEDFLKTLEDNLNKGRLRFFGEPSEVRKIENLNEDIVGIKKRLDGISETLDEVEKDEMEFEVFIQEVMPFIEELRKVNFVIVGKGYIEFVNECLKKNIF